MEIVAGTNIQCFVPLDPSANIVRRVTARSDQLSSKISFNVPSRQEGIVRKCLDEIGILFEERRTETSGTWVDLTGIVAIKKSLDHLLKKELIHSDFYENLICNFPKAFGGTLNLSLDAIVDNPKFSLTTQDILEFFAPSEVITSLHIPAPPSSDIQSSMFDESIIEEQASFSIDFESIVPEKEVSAVRSALSNGVTDALIKIMSNKRLEFKGVWYPSDLKTYFSEKQDEMPSDYWSGYANTEYFEKTGRFTFKLKEGISASKAIDALIDGPSVLDCGNATQLAYYKAILGVIGSEKFDKFFAEDSFRLKITQNGITDKDAPILYFVDVTDATKKHLKDEIGNRPPQHW